MEQQYKRCLVEEEDLKWKPEQVSSSENMLIKVQVSNDGCSPRQPIPHGQKWNEQSKTLKQVSKNVFNLSFTTGQ